MKLDINHDLCIGCGACVAVAPELIDMSDEQLAVVIVDIVKTEEIDTAKEAIECCPVDAVYEVKTEDFAA